MAKCNVDVFQHTKQLNLTLDITHIPSLP